MSRHAETREAEQPRVGLVVVSHDGIGRALVDTARRTLGKLPLSVGQVVADESCEPEQRVQDAMRLVSDLDRGAGTLILTDLYGATPSNIATRLGKLDNVRIVTGLNLPMLIRVFNYADLSLEDLAQKALSGGRDGVIEIAVADGQAAGQMQGES